MSEPVGVLFMPDGDLLDHGVSDVRAIADFAPWPMGLWDRLIPMSRPESPEPHSAWTALCRDHLGHPRRSSGRGAGIFAETIREVRTNAPGALVEVLIPDFKGMRRPFERLLRARPDVLTIIWKRSRGFTLRCGRGRDTTVHSIS